MYIYKAVIIIMKGLAKVLQVTYLSITMILKYTFVHP